MHSPYGWHLVLLVSRESARLPDLDEIEDRVREDYESFVTPKRRNEAESVLAHFAATHVDF